MEAIISRPVLLNAVGRLVKTGRQKILHPVTEGDPILLQP
jgi:hypothetical protein